MTTQPGACRGWILSLLRDVAEQAQDALLRAKRLQGLQATWRLRLAESLFAPPVLTIPQAPTRRSDPLTASTPHQDRATNRGRSSRRCGRADDRPLRYRPGRQAR